MRSWYLYLLHIFAATIGSMALAAMVLFLLFPVARFVNSDLSFRSFNRVLSHPAFPLQILAGLLMGYGYQSRFKSTFAHWVWAIPMMIWIYEIVSFRPSSVFEDVWHARLWHFVGSGCRPPACFDQMRYTAPVYTAAAYSLGALLQSKGMFLDLNKSSANHPHCNTGPK